MYNQRGSKSCLTPISKSTGFNQASLINSPQRWFFSPKLLIPQLLTS
jgi:hypothetical protein